MALALATTAVVITASSPAPPTAQPITEAPDTATAINAARAQGTEVEALNMRTATREVFAQPSGVLQARLSAAPQRVKRGNDWVPIDTALAAEDKSVAPKATGVGLAFSKGGTDPLVRLSKEGKEFALTWPGELPKPELNGPTATYRDVLSGVDLRLTARNDGYEQLFVVKDRAAAAHVAAIKLGVKTSGLTVKQGERGAFDLLDSAGETVFAVPRSLMWDSKKQEDDEAPRTDHRPVGVEFGADTLTLVPDQALLTDTATVYPVYIDPAPREKSNNGWTTVYDNGTDLMREETHWNGVRNEAESKWWVRIDPTARSGRAYQTTPKLITRSYFQYDTSFLVSAQVFSARMDATVVHAPTCDVKHWHELHVAAADISSTTNWNNQPGDLANLASYQVPAVWDKCSDHKSFSFTRSNFHDYLDRSGNSTFWIGAGEDENAWRKFDPAAMKLVIEYNSTPYIPWGTTTKPDVNPCGNCGDVAWVADSSITLEAAMADPDGEQIQSKWTVDDYVPGQYEQKRTQVLWGGVVPSNSVASYTLPLTDMADNREVLWSAAAHDGSLTSGPWLGPKKFRIDRTAPVAKPGVVSATYPEDNNWHGGTTVPGEFAFTANEPDIDRFEYGWDSATPETVPANRLGGSATVTLTPPGDGPRDLFVRTRDKAGNPGPLRTYHIYVRAGSGAIAQYTMDGNVRDSAYLGERHGTTHGTAGFTTGAVGSALALDGSGHATAPNAVRTDTSFSVSSWVKLDDLNAYRSAVTQDGNAVCGFCLQYQPSQRRWVFVLPQQDSASPTSWALVESQEEPTPGAWTHLTGVLDAEARQARLYVNGVLQGTAPVSSLWHAAGDLRIGQAKSNNTFVNNWVGGIDEVRLHDRALTDAEVRGEVRRDNVQVGHWRFEDDPGTVARNTVIDGEQAKLSGGALFFEQRAQPKNNALRLDGTGQARTTGPVVRTNKSFTVSASVKLTDTSGPMTVLSQDGPNSSGFVLQQRDGRWLFGMIEANGSTAWNVYAQSAPGTAAANTPTHLAAVFDAGTKKATLYVNGVEAAVSAAATKPFWEANGPFVMGSDQQGAFLKGDLDDVRVHSRTLAADEVREIVTLDTAPSRSWRMDGDGVDVSGNNGVATLGSPVDWVSGQSNTSDPKDLAVRLTGVDGASMHADHAVDTSRSFSVSTWARLDKVGSYAAVLSQDGNTTSAFQLQATPDGHWSLAMFSRDEPGGGPRHDRAIGAVAQVSVWTHLVGVYDAERDRMALYINGVEAASAAHPDAWDRPSGKFRIGRAQWNSGATDHFPGAIDDVETYNRVLFADEIRAKAGRDLNLVHKWQFDEGVGATAGDAVGGKAGTLNNATYAPGRLGNAVSFNGTNADVSTNAVPRTDQNYTISAWVYLPAECSPRCKKIAISQDGEHNSKFRLGYVRDRDLAGNWIFEMPEDDVDTTVITKAAVSAEPSDYGNWVHLAGTYDRSAKQLLLYVNGSRRGEGVLNSAWQASGGVQIGRAKLASNSAERWTGSVDDVRMYTGALDRQGVFDLYRSYPAQDQPAATMPVADAGNWKLDENTGTTAADSSGRGNNVTFSGGSAWTGGRTGAGAWLDGSSGAGETTGPIIDTSRSYSVSAWAYMPAGSTGNRSIVAQDGQHDSAFALSYNGDSGRWAVVQPHADQNGGDATVLVSSEPAMNAHWTHLVVTYDAELKQLRLYVNGVMSAVKVGAIGWSSSGPFTIGRSKWNGVKGNWFYRGVDDVRVFRKALSAGEIVKVHDDVPLVTTGVYTFDDNDGKDSSWRGNNATLTSGTSFVPGVIGQTLRSDGSGAAQAGAYGVNTHDSFTVSAWARLDSDQRTAAVLGQDAAWVSAFVLQYRPESKRWAFGTHVQDSSSAPMTKALSAEPAVLGRWTHLAGVYDHATGQLRLYVDGKLAGAESARMLVADGPFTIGRGKAQGKAVDQFNGLIDEVRVEEGAASEAQLLRRTTRPLPPAGQIGRYISINGSGEHYTGLTTAAPLDGYRLEGVQGLPVSPTDPNTTRLYSCKQGDDHFTSIAANCEGAAVIGEAGAVYTVKPTNIPTVGLYRCVIGGDRFTSTAANCEGQTNQKFLGYLRAYAPLARYVTPDVPSDNWSTPHGVWPGYQFEGVLGHVVMTSQPGTTALWSCQNGRDLFSSLDPECEGKKKLGGVGWVWNSPPTDVPSKPLDRCKVSTTGQRFDSVMGCEGHQVEQRLGYLLENVPAVAPTF